MKRVAGFLSWGCGSLGVALLALALMLFPAQSALADLPGDPVPVVKCADCSCSTMVGQPCYYGVCGVAAGCSTSCGCTGPDTGGNDCYCVGPS